MPPLLVVAGQIARALASGLFGPANSPSRKLLIAGGFTASGLRLAAGMTVGKLGPRPSQPLLLWDCELDSTSRSVREALSSLDLDAQVRPCPAGGARFRPELREGRLPRLEDPNAGVALTGSRPILEHLHQRYGTGRAPPTARLLSLAPAAALTGLAVRLLTGGRGGRARPSRRPDRPLELWSFEASPYCRLVRALLSELELPYLLHNVAKDSPRRPEFVALSEKTQVPWLLDPNTGARLFESLAIERYLMATYAL